MNGLAYVEYSDILNINSSALLVLGGEIEFIYLEFNKLDVLYDANTCLTHLDISLQRLADMLIVQ